MDGLEEGSFIVTNVGSIRTYKLLIRGLYSTKKKGSQTVNGIILSKNKPSQQKMEVYYFNA